MLLPLFVVSLLTLLYGDADDKDGDNNGNVGDGDAAEEE